MKKIRLQNLNSFKNFQRNAPNKYTIRLFTDAKNKGKSILAFGAAKGNTLLNF